MNKTIIVTGGTRGIGRAISEELLLSGFEVIATYQKKEPEFFNKKLKVIQCDNTKLEEVKNILSYCKNNELNVCGLVNNAGIINDGYMLMMSETKFKEVLENNILGTFNITKAIINLFRMKKISGKIVNISSTSGIAGQKGQINYSSSKAALIGFTKTLAKEMAENNILVNAVSPGFIETDMTKKIKNKDKISKDYIPLGRFGRPEEVAKLVRFLISEDNTYITGKNITIDGGMIND